MRFRVCRAVPGSRDTPRTPLSNATPGPAGIARTIFTAIPHAILRSIKALLGLRWNDRGRNRLRTGDPAAVYLVSS